MNEGINSSYKILIIDDDASFRKILELRLRSFMPDIQLTTFDNLGSARDFLRKESNIDFDLIILDEHLPDGRGAEFLNEGWFESLAVLSVSSDPAPDIPGTLLKAGATYFLKKTDVSEPLFKWLVLGIIDRNKLMHELGQSKIDAAIMETVKTLVGTLRHEINNPLGAVLGAAYLLRTQETASEEQKHAAELVESSGKRIKFVLDQLCQAIAVEPVVKASQKVFHVPGDKPWEE